jgi:hypothetical protein
MLKPGQFPQPSVCLPIRPLEHAILAPLDAYHLTFPSEPDVAPCFRRARLSPTLACRPKSAVRD